VAAVALEAAPQRVEQILDVEGLEKDAAIGIGQDLTGAVHGIGGGGAYEHGDPRRGGTAFDGDAGSAIGNRLFGGIFMSVNGTGATIRDNVVDTTVFGEDGIFIGRPGDTIAGNVARNDSALGIDAVAGNTDGGGNRASGNGDARQCVGVTCSP